LLEKLIENWLDSASERTYQPIFCQMLMNEGYTVIHSTRHTPQEYGKDVIAIAADGVPCAFQLKGNPKSTLTLSQYRLEVAPQLRELKVQRIENPAVPKGSHRSYLVTNGEIEELVQQAIEQENEKESECGYSDRKLETIARGQLLCWARKLDTSLWPSELEDTKVFLEILTSGGNDLFPVQKFHSLLIELLRLNSECVKVPKAEQKRRAASAALLTVICLKPFAERENHWAVATGWLMFSIYLASFASKYGGTSGVDHHLKFAEDIIFKALKDLLEEVLERPECLGEGEVLSDCVAYPWRYTLLVSIAGIFCLWANKEGIWPEGDFKDRLQGFLPDQQDGLDIWGDAAFPQALFHLWALEQKDGKARPDFLKALLLRCLNQPQPCIYHEIEDVIRHRLSDTLEAFQSPIVEDLEDEVSTSGFARQLMLHMAFREEKEECKDMWAEYSKISSTFFVPASVWEYGLYRTKEGQNLTHVPKDQEEWDALKRAAEADATSMVPEALLKRSWCCVYGC